MGKRKNNTKKISPSQAKSTQTTTSQLPNPLENIFKAMGQPINDAVDNEPTPGKNAKKKNEKERSPSQAKPTQTTTSQLPNPLQNIFKAAGQPINDAMDN